MGGIWESLIKSVKPSLKAIIKNVIFTGDCHTFLCEVAPILNGRQDDITDPGALTPNHLLICFSSSNFSSGKFNSSEINLTKKWRSVQAASDMFWKRCVREYLPLLLMRKKWSQKLQNFKVGDLVLIASDDAPRSSWFLDRIIEVFVVSNI